MGISGHAFGIMRIQVAACHEGTQDPAAHIDLHLGYGLCIYLRFFKLMPLTRLDVIAGIHESYVAAEMNLASAKIARAACDKLYPKKQLFAGGFVCLFQFCQE